MPLLCSEPVCSIVAGRVEAVMQCPASFCYVGLLYVRVPNSNEENISFRILLLRRHDRPIGVHDPKRSLALPLNSHAVDA